MAGSGMPSNTYKMQPAVGKLYAISIAAFRAQLQSCVSRGRGYDSLVDIVNIK